MLSNGHYKAISPNAQLGSANLRNTAGCITKDCFRTTIPARLPGAHARNAVPRHAVADQSTSLTSGTMQNIRCFAD